MNDVSQLIVILHILKYPVALQHTPIEQKFGINGTISLFLQPVDAERIRNFLENNILNTLQEISDNDPEAQRLRKWIEEQPDISEDELQEQIADFEKNYPTKTNFFNEE